MGENLATELLHEVKAQSKRWFIAFCVMVFVELATIAGFLWYISLPTAEDVVTQTTDGTDNRVVGIGDYNGETDDQENSESNAGSEDGQ
jgi:hypothetical protein